jgi:hypothetical protein
MFFPLANPAGRRRPSDCQPRWLPPPPPPVPVRGPWELRVIVMCCAIQQHSKLHRGLHGGCARGTGVVVWLGGGRDTPLGPCDAAITGLGSTHGPGVFAAATRHIPVSFMSLLPLSFYVCWHQCVRMGMHVDAFRDGCSPRAVKAFCFVFGRHTFCCCLCGK